MATDPNKKTLRHFQCRDYLWETFEQMSAELECSVDYLINESMRQYARSRGHGGAVATASHTGSDEHATIPPAAARSGPPAMPAVAVPHSNRPAPMMPAVGRPGAAGMSAPPLARVPGIPHLPSASGSSGVPSMPRIPSLSGGGQQPQRSGLSAHGPGIAQRGGPPGLPPIGAGRPAGGPPPMPLRASIPPGPPPMPRTSTGGVPHLPGMAAARPPLVAPTAGQVTVGNVLYAIYQGQRYPVDKDEFIIGRGQKTSDLVIKDSNVSRRHAVVVRHNGQYWIVDQQSTNGVEFMGAKIDRKRIEDGDLYKICDYEIQFTYR